MKPSHSPQRRQLLQWSLGAPLLPLSASLATTLSLGGCATGPLSSQRGKVQSVAFTSMPAPTEPQAMSTMTVQSSMVVTDTAGRQQSFPLSYASFFTTGDQVPNALGGQILAGGYFNAKGEPIMDTSVPGQSRQFFSDCPDGSTLTTVKGASVKGVKGNLVFAVVQFEYTSFANDNKTKMYGQLPSPIAVLTLDQDPSTGKLKLIQYHNVDTAPVQGLWITCGASLSPWGTHLSSEEYQPDAFDRNNKSLKGFSRHFFGDANVARAYHYGHMPEVSVQPDGTGRITKHYCMGRISHELVEVMPDERTVLMGDDTNNGGYFAFVADRPRDLSSGTLYVARLDGPLTQVRADAPAVGLEWVRLGHATSDQVRAWADQYQPEDILDMTRTDPKDDLFTRIWANGKKEWIRIKPGMELMAAFLETHRYAALKGASLGFSKMEGTTLNARDKILYSALSYCKDSMVKGNKAHNPQARVDLSKALNAGAVMALKLTDGLKDTEGQTIRSEWMPVVIKTLLVGEDLSKPDRMGNSAHADRIANPDNLKFSETMRVLFIGEDSGMHVNNFLWAYHVDTGKLSRVLSTPVGAESTGLHAAEDVNGWTYILSNFQHPGEYIKTLNPEVKRSVDGLLKANYKQLHGASVGYLTLG